MRPAKILHAREVVPAGQNLTEVEKEVSQMLQEGLLPEETHTHSGNRPRQSCRIYLGISKISRIVELQGLRSGDPAPNMTTLDLESHPRASPLTQFQLDKQSQNERESSGESASNEYLPFPQAGIGLFRQNPPQLVSMTQAARSADMRAASD